MKGVLGSSVEAERGVKSADGQQGQPRDETKNERRATDARTRSRGAASERSHPDSLHRHARS